jgi:hypothetical protein
MVWFGQGGMGNPHDEGRREARVFSRPHYGSGAGEAQRAALTGRGTGTGGTAGDDLRTTGTSLRQQASANITRRQHLPPANREP